MVMNWKRNWLRVKSGAFRKAQPIRRKPLARFRPVMERLEDRHAPATLIVNGVLDNTTSDGLLTLREAVLLVNNSGNASAALGHSLTTGEQAQITVGFGSN